MFCVDNIQYYGDSLHMTDRTSPIPTIAQLQSNSLSSVVQHEIERLILSGEIQAGTRVNELALAARLGVSRGPIREACRALVEIGLLELVPSRGTFVRKMDRRDANEIYDLRAGLTGLAAMLLAPQITDEQIEDLEGLFEAMDAAAQAGDFNAFNQANLEFHDAIVVAAGNSRLIKSYRALVKEFQLFREHGMVQAGAQKISNDEHRTILDALRARDAAAAYEASFDHVSKGKGRMFVALENMAQGVSDRNGGAEPKYLHSIE